MSKTKLIIILLILLWQLRANATNLFPARDTVYDRIILKNNDTIIGKVLEISDKKTVYTPCCLKSRKELRNSKIEKVIFSNGKILKFKHKKKLSKTLILLLIFLNLTAPFFGIISYILVRKFFAKEDKELKHWAFFLKLSYVINFWISFFVFLLLTTIFCYLIFCLLL